MGISSEAANSVFNITDRNNSFSINTPELWIPGRGELKLRAQDTL